MSSNTRKTLEVAFNNIFLTTEKVTVSCESAIAPSDDYLAAKESDMSPRRRWTAKQG